MSVGGTIRLFRDYYKSMGIPEFAPDLTHLKLCAQALAALCEGGKAIKINQPKE